MLWKDLRALLMAHGVQPKLLDAIAPLLPQDAFGVGLEHGNGKSPFAPTQESLPALPHHQDLTVHERGAGLSMALHLDEEEEPTDQVTQVSREGASSFLSLSPVDMTVVAPPEDLTIVVGQGSPFVVEETRPTFEKTARLGPPPKAPAMRHASLRPAALKNTKAADTRVMGAPSQEDFDAYQHPFDDLDLHDPTIVVGLPMADVEGEQRESEVFEEVSARYKDLGLIGIGGMGEIRRMLDRNLNRIVAMKLLKPELLDDVAMVERFFEEAQVTAQLEHPGIIPTHEVGRWEDGRIYFTMREIRGQTLAQVLQTTQPTQPTQVLQSSRASAWSLRRLLNLFQRACEAVGYAHDRGVVHRDIKPANMIVGAHGEIQVVDWGLVKRLMPKSSALPVGKAVTLQWDRQDNSPPGLLLGTPRYMAPEQILRPDEVDERSDVYSLGVILYEILAGRSPYQEKSVRKVLMKKMEGFPPPPGRTAASGLRVLPPWAPLSGPLSFEDLHILPDGLMEICAKALAPEAIDRYANAGTLAKVIEGWLAGLQKRRAAQEVVARAAQKAQEEMVLRAQVKGLRQEAQVLAQGLEGWEPEEEKWAMWHKEEEAALLEQRAESLLIESIQLLQGALTHEPEFEKAHLALAERYHQQHQAAEATNDMSRLLHAEARLRQHTSALPTGHERRLTYQTYLRGDGAVTLHTSPADAMIQIARFEPKGRRLMEVPLNQALSAPLEGHVLPYGSYVLTIESEASASVRYPIFIERGTHWKARAPGETQDALISLPAYEEVSESECFVPQGWSLLGGDPDNNIAPSRVWVDDYIIQRDPVTNQEYLDFLNAIVAQGRVAEAIRCVPRERAGGIEEQGAMIYGRLDDGSFYLRTDADGDTWQPDWPVVMVDWNGAVSYARWLRRQTKLPWRLPWEVEWEKAARGVDGRLYPWGEAFDPSWCCMRKSRKVSPMIAPVGDFPIDKSVYGVRGMGGNVGDWCLDLFTKGALFFANERFIPPENQHKAERRLRVLRGGHWSSEAFATRFSFRSGYHEQMRFPGGGIRLVRPLSPHNSDSFVQSQDFVAPKRWF